MNSRTAAGLRAKRPRAAGTPARSKTRFMADLRFTRAMDSALQAGNVELGPQACLGLQPVLVERVDPVDLPVAMGEVAERPNQGVEVVEVGHPVVLGEGIAKLRAE